MSEPTAPTGPARDGVDAAESSARPRRRGVARAGRIVSGIAVLALTGGAVALAGVLPEADPAPVPGDHVDVAASRTTLVCPGPLRLPDDSTSGDSAFDRVPVAPVERVFAVDLDGSGTARLAAQDGRGAELTGTTGSLAGPAAPVVLTADPVDGEPARVAGTTSSVVSAGDLRGIAAGGCTRPSSDVWLLGGSTALESTADLVLVNAGATPADITVDAWGPSGPVELAGGGSYLVAPGENRAVVLPGVAAEQRRLAVHVSAAGGQVAAYLQDALLDGFTPRGTDLVTAGAGPSTRQVVPGIVVPAADVDAPDAGSLRLLAPGEEGATASVRLLGPDGEVGLAGAEDVDLAPGEVTDVSLGGIPAGAYTAVVDATAPVVASASIAREGEAGELDQSPRLERAWSAASVPGDGVAVVPAGATTSVVLSAVAPAEGTGEGADDAPTPSPTPSASPGAAPSPEPTQGQLPDPEAAAAPVGPTLTVTVRGYGADGVTGEQDVEVPVGSTVVLPVARLGTGVVGVEVRTAGDDGDGAGADVAWALFGSVSQGDGELVTVVGPTTEQRSATQAVVREGSRLGLG